MKLLHKVLLLFAILISVISLMAYDAFYSAPFRFTIRYETLSSIYIPEQMNDISILYFSDLDYGTFMDQSRLNRLINRINGLSADIVLFGGDLIDEAVTQLSNEEINTLTTKLKEIDAPLGKFAILGDFDYKSTDRLNQVKKILYDSDFELLVNQSVMLRNEGSQGINLVGLDSQLGGYININSAFANVPRTSYALVVGHEPSGAKLVPTDITKYYLAGHTHGGQAFWGFGASYLPPGSEEYLRGKHDINGSFTLDITNGVGTTDTDVRFLTNAEIVLYRLEHRSITDNN